MKEEIQTRIEDTLNSLDGLQGARANPFLAARIRHRLQQKVPAPVLPAQWSWRLVAVMIVFIFLNIITARRVMENKVDARGAKAVATDYSISLPEAY